MIENDYIQLFKKFKYTIKKYPTKILKPSSFKTKLQVHKKHTKHKSESYNKINT